MVGSITSNSSSRGSKKDSKRGGIDLKEGEEVRLHNTRFKGSKTPLKERQDEDNGGDSTRSSRSTIKKNSSSSSDDCSIISPEAIIHSFKVRGKSDVSTARKSNAGIKRGLSFNLTDLSMPKVSKVQGQRGSANGSAIDAKFMSSIKILGQNNPDSLKTHILRKSSVRRPNLEPIGKTADDDCEITFGLNAVLESNPEEFRQVVGSHSKVFIAPLKIGNVVKLYFISPVEPAEKNEHPFEMNVPVPLVDMNSENARKKMASMNCPVSIEVVTKPDVAIKKVNIGTQTKKPPPPSRTIKSKVLPTKLVKESGAEIIAKKRVTRSSSRQNDKIEEARVSKASATAISIISETEEHQESEDQSTQNNGDSLVDENSEGNESNINPADDENDSSEGIDPNRCIIM